MDLGGDVNDFVVKLSADTANAPRSPGCGVLAVRWAGWVLDMGVGSVGPEAMFGELDLFVDVVAQFGKAC